MCDSHDDSIADLHRVLGALLDVDLGGVDDDALHDVVISTGRAEARLAAAKARLLAEWDRRKLWRSNGSLRALVEMATRSKTTPSNGTRPRPLYTVLVGYETFAGRLCELDDGTVIAPEFLLGDLSKADIERVVFDAPDRVLSVSQRRRFTGALRRAIQVRDRHCQHPSGCDVPSSDCDVDHIVPWPLGRDTSQSNGRLACTSHNRLPETNAPHRDGAGGVERRRPPPSS